LTKSPNADLAAPYQHLVLQAGSREFRGVISKKEPGTAPVYWKGANPARSNPE